MPLSDHQGGERREALMNVQNESGPSLGLHRRSQCRRAADLHSTSSIRKTTSLVFTAIHLAAIFFGLLSILFFVHILWRQRPGPLFDLGNAHLPDRPADAPADHAQPGSLDLILNPSQHAKRPAQVLHHHWRITAGDRSPDGVKKQVYLINDAFPGPTVEARSGDTLVIEVENALDEGLAIHWHGLHMRGFNHMDGAVGFTQDPVPSGANFSYEFDISEDQAGSFWWHAHHQEQRADGLYGGLIVHRPIDKSIIVPEPAYDEERLLMIGDWYHRSAKDVLAWYMRAGSYGNEPVPDSLLVNGLGAYNCSNAVPARPVECVQHDEIPNLTFDAGKKYRLRVVNTGSLAGITLGIEGASLTAFEVDGGNAVQSTSASSVGTLFPGQRVDLLLEWLPSTPSTKHRTLTIELDSTDFKYPNPALTNPHHFPVLLSSSPSPAPPTPPTTRSSLRPSPSTQPSMSSSTISTTRRTRSICMAWHSRSCRAIKRRRWGGQGAGTRGKGRRRQRRRGSWSRKARARAARQAAAKHGAGVYLQVAS